MKGTEVKNQQTLNDIKTRELLSMLRKIALPIALQSLIGSSLSLIDNLMVGSLGELQLNAVGVSVQIFFVYWIYYKIYSTQSTCPGNDFFHVLLLVFQFLITFTNPVDLLADFRILFGQFLV